MQDNQFDAFQQQRVCENNGKTCSNHGRCLHTTCKCNTGWEGNACEKALYPNGCSGHGKYVHTSGHLLVRLLQSILGGLLLMGLAYYFLIHRQKTKDRNTYLKHMHSRQPLIHPCQTTCLLLKCHQV